MSAAAGRSHGPGSHSANPSGGSGAPGAIAVRIWDLPTRLFHWSLVVCVVGSIIAANMGGNTLAWHFRFGYAILTLLLFRLVWGFVGPRYARFSSFPPNPVAALKYLRAGDAVTPGHSPLGALSVYAILVVLAIQAVTGLFANDAILWEGPLRHTVSNATSDRLTSLHLSNRYVLIGLIVLHLVAIAWYAVAKRRKLVKPMILGDGDYVVDPPVQLAPAPAADGAGVRLGAAALLAVCAALVWFMVTQIA